MSGFDFNTESFIAGLGVGWGTAFALYRARGRVSSVVRAATGQQSAQSEGGIRGVDGRYLTELVRFCQSNHLAGERAELADLLVEPTFILPPQLAKPPEEDIVGSVFDVVPRHHDLPYLHASYNIETIRIEELDNGADSIAILGLPGSGRTTTLQAIALWVLGQVDFVPPHDVVQERIEAEEAELKDDERKKRAAERSQAENMAKQRLAQARGDSDAEADGERVYHTPLRGKVPLMVNFNDIILRSRDYGRSVDPAEPVIRAAQFGVGPLTRRIIPRGLYARFEEGKVLLLVDGFDQLPDEERKPKLDWLRALREMYPGTFVIATGPATGYNDLVDTGLAPVFLRPLSDVSANELITKWADAWPQIKGARRADPPPPVIVDNARSDIRARTPFDLALKAWGTFADPEETDYLGWMERVLAQYAEDALQNSLPQLTAMASLQLDEQVISIKRLEERLSGTPAENTDIKRTTGTLRAIQTLDEDDLNNDDPFGEDDPFAGAGTDDDDLDALFGDDADDIEPTVVADDASNDDDAEPVTEDEEETEEPNTQVGKEYARLLDTLVKAGLVTRFRGDRYRFRFSGMANFLASLGIAEMSNDIKREKVASPNWNGAFALATLHTEVTDMVDLRIAAPADVLHNNILEMAGWLGYANTRLEWRSTILRELGNMFVAPMQYSLARERIAAALVSTRDRGVERVFSTGATHPNPHVRLLSVLGLGAIRAENSVVDVASLLDDPDDQVKLGAALALGAIGTEPALEEMVIAFTTPNERIQQAIAEAFAAIPDEGYPVLYDAADHQDMALRRAAVFGLRRINTDWAMVSVYRRMLEDDQWYVRSAAEIAFSGMNYGDAAQGPYLYPPVEGIPWVREWISSLGDVAQQTTKPEQFLPKAMQEASPDLQELAASNIGQLGLMHDVALLYTALRHRDSRVREASHRALGDLQLRTGQPLPAPM